MLDRGVERAGDPQRAADGDSEAAFRALYCAAAHVGARGELGACKVLLEAEQGNRVVHAPHTTQIVRRRKVIIFYFFLASRSDTAYHCQAPGWTPAQRSDHVRLRRDDGCRARGAEHPL